MLGELLPLDIMRLDMANMGHDGALSGPQGQILTMALQGGAAVGPSALDKSPMESSARSRRDGGV